MKALRVTALVAIALFGSTTAHAKLGVIMDRTYVSSAGSVPDMYNHELYVQKLVVELLERAGIEYVMIPPAAAKTEFLRTGTVVWNFGTPAARTETFDAFLHVDFNGKLTSLFPTYRPDSLTMSAVAGNLVTSVLAVPQLMWFYQRNSVGTAVTDTAGDTVGFATTGPQLLNAATSGAQFPAMAVSASGKGFITSSYVGHLRAKTASEPAGGFRGHIGTPRGGSSIDDPYYALTFGNQTAGWLDSTACVGGENMRAMRDSVWLFERPMAHISGAKPIVFAGVFGVSGCTDSSSGANEIACEWDAFMALASLARLDSLTSGRVFGNNKVPLKMGLVIRGGFNRSGIRHPGGIAPHDTTALKQSIDSLATLSPPIRAVLVADVDSVESYPSEKGWWDRLAKLKFSPYTRAGIDTSARGGNAAFNRPVDVWGRWRVRKAYLEPGAAGWDTTVYGGVRGLFFKADSIWDGTRISHFLVAPNDDWSPKNLSISSDSVLYAARKAGAKGILFNAQVPVSGVNPVGYPWSTERSWNTAAGQIKTLGHSGFSIHGSRYLMDVRSDSVNWAAGIAQIRANDQYTFVSLPGYEVHRAWNQFFHSKYRDFDFMPNNWNDAWDDVNTPDADRVWGLRKGSVFVMHVNDFGGGDDPNTATRPGWWVVKSMHNMFAIINELAGRTIIEFDYPENITP